jgi:hypothetical protein
MARAVTALSFLREKEDNQEPKLSCGMAAPLTHLLFWVIDKILLLLTLLRVLMALHVLFLTSLLSPFFFIEAMYPRALIDEAQGIFT